LSVFLCYQWFQKEEKDQTKILIKLIYEDSSDLINNNSNISSNSCSNSLFNLFNIPINNKNESVEFQQNNIKTIIKDTKESSDKTKSELTNSLNTSSNTNNTNLEVNKSFNKKHYSIYDVKSNQKLDSDVNEELFGENVILY